MGSEFLSSFHLILIWFTIILSFLTSFLVFFYGSFVSFGFTLLSSSSDKRISSEIGHLNCRSNILKDNIFVLLYFFPRRFCVLVFENLLDWFCFRYMNCFQQPRKFEQMSYEVSDEYFTDNKTPYRASNLLKSAKILIILEDPVKRAFYHYQVLVLCTKNF